MHHSFAILDILIYNDTYERQINFKTCRPGALVFTQRNT